MDLPEGSYGPEIRCAGRPIGGRLRGAVLEFTLENLRPGGEQQILIGYKERVRAESLAELLAFPFLDGARPACQIVADDGAQAAAESLQRYFTYVRLQGEFGDWFQRKPNADIPRPTDVPAIPLAHAPRQAGTSCVVLGPLDFVGAQLKGAGADGSALPVVPSGAIRACVRVAQGRQHLAIVFGADVPATRFNEFLALLDEGYPTEPGYHRNLKRRMTRADRGLLRAPVEGQPRLGWHDLLKRLP